MSIESYKRLLRSTYVHLNKTGISTAMGKLLDEIMIMPHPEKEEVFVRFSSGTMPFPTLSVMSLNSDQKEEIETSL